MARFPLILNEISCRFDMIPAADRIDTVINTIKTIRAAKKIRADLDFITFQNLNQITFTVSGTCISLSALLGGYEHIEEWRFLKSVVQVSPFESFPPGLHPLETEEVSYGMERSVGLTWAWKNTAFALSFSCSPVWNVDEIDADLTVIIDHIERSEVVKIKNLFAVNNVPNWNHQILYFGADFSSSSLVYECNEFAARMYLRDHNPPHIHLYKNATSQEVIARFNVRHLEFLETKTYSIRANLLAWARPRQAQLLESWERCQRGELPLSCD